MGTPWDEMFPIIGAGNIYLCKSFAKCKRDTRERRAVTGLAPIDESVSKMTKICRGNEQLLAKLIGHPFCIQNGNSKQIIDFGVINSNVQSAHKEKSVDGLFITRMVPIVFQQRVK